MLKRLPILILGILVLGCTLPGGGSNTIRINFQRPVTSPNYSDWGLHVWNINGTGGISASAVTVWEDPMRPTGFSDFGSYFDIPYEDLSNPIGFVPHRISDVDDKGLYTSDREFPTDGTTEIWIIDGLGTIFTEAPDLVPTTAQITNTTTIEIVFSEAPDASITFSLLDSSGSAVTGVTEVLSGSTLTYTFDTEIDFSETYLLEFNGITTVIGYSNAVLELPELIYTGDDLGVSYTLGGDATFKLWSPTATEVQVVIFDDDDQSVQVGSNIDMVKGDFGVWSVVVTPTDVGVTTLDKHFYQYEVSVGSSTNTALDPYAKSMAAFYGSTPGQDDYVGKAAIIDLDSADAGTVGTRPGNVTGSSPILDSMTESIFYEVHIRDYTVSNPVVTSGNEGTFVGFAEGVDHLVDLGITHVQLLPVMNHYRVDETDRSFQDNGQASPNFNWGYDPHSYFALEGQYATDATDPYVRIREFKELVSAMHAEGIGVIIDVVYNHTYSNNTLNNVAPGLYYRPPSDSHPVGDPPVASERPMVRKMIIDSLKMMVDYYQVDGFRFDLMGFMDVETLREIRAELGDDIILHGEGWNFTDIADGAVKGSGQYPHDIDLAAFNDAIRDEVKGSGDDGAQEDEGWVQGSGNFTRMLTGMTAGVYDFDDNTGILLPSKSYDWFTDDPSEAIQYLGVHDGFTWWDKINLTVDGTVAERAKIYNQSAALLFTSQGKILFQAGAEFGRTKPLAAGDPEPTRAASTALVNPDPDITPSISSLHNNTYSSGDFTNQILWSRKTDTTNGFADIYTYFQGLVAMRRAIPAFRYATTADLNAGLEYHLDTSDATATPVGYSDFSFVDTEGLTINFINGPTSGTYYLVGEVFATTADTSDIDQNPSTNPYEVVFTDGEASINFTDSSGWDDGLDAWGVAGSLNILLVEAPGEWDKPNGYSGQGNNTILANQILPGPEITVDLDITDHAPSPGTGEVDNERAFGYTLDNTLQANSSGYDDILVVHNSDTSAFTMTAAILSGTLQSDWTVILDDDEVDHVNGTTPPAGYSIDGTAGTITVPANTSIVVAK